MIVSIYFLFKKVTILMTQTIQEQNYCDKMNVFEEKMGKKGLNTQTYIQTDRQTNLLHT